MAVLKIPDENRTLDSSSDVTSFLAARGIEYEKLGAAPNAGAESTSAEILAAYAPTIDALKAKGGYVTADVIDVKPDTPNLDAMLKKFSTEHWHDEDEVRLIVEGRGLFHIHPPNEPVFALEVEAGDLIRVPRGTHHWFDLCGERRIRAIRLFQDASGWTPHYTQSGIDSHYQPLCFGPAYIPTERIDPAISV
jgi:1,2-dihydroxy-3-keto-5-methylthiopentene dioxygenase